VLGGYLDVERETRKSTSRAKIFFAAADRTPGNAFGNTGAAAGATLSEGKIDAA
jgi:hypothetical protein